MVWVKKWEQSQFLRGVLKCLLKQTLPPLPHVKMLPAKLQSSRGKLNQQDWMQHSSAREKTSHRIYLFAECLSQNHPLTIKIHIHTHLQTHLSRCLLLLIITVNFWRYTIKEWQFPRLQFHTKIYMNKSMLYNHWLICQVFGSVYNVRDGNGVENTETTTDAFLSSWSLQPNGEGRWKTNMPK